MKAQQVNPRSIIAIGFTVKVLCLSRSGIKMMILKRTDQSIRMVCEYSTKGGKCNIR